MFNDDYCNYSFFLFVDICSVNGESSIIISRWINSGNLSLDWSLQLNLLTASMVLMVNLVSTLIHIYSVGYMDKDPKKFYLWHI